ncbi:aminopeptidase N [Roseibium alexandrii]|uniref:Aminopeptidase N n=1 Tax=Roseibium alexandrii (strain DSM 17067 / NCIMB 14079 / DFL-11) TaxID=244592 RepID=A0A5E8H6Q7_ROSAD|nr:aminopeptidase N [Roseibium alexandrii]EEE47856.1 aminopeptidase N [Roseibium alexandrii DFL-11]
MPSETPTTIKLEDYQPPAYRIETANLNVLLDPTATLVIAELKVVRQPDTKPGAPLILDGDNLKLLSIAVDGAPLQSNAYDVTPSALELTPPTGDTFTLTITTELNPDANTQLMGLYRSSGTYCTQCEADGFRRITYFPDRPDVLSVYTVRLEAPRDACPVLLSNGNLIKTGLVPDTDRHFAIWHDPHPKPAYLFALVAGDLAKITDNFTTASGNPVELNIFVEHGKEALCDWAMDSLKRSMRWDEEAFGREYDLDVFNIVAVSDFNMGAMENKGLNIFNDKYVLADPETATDQDYANIEAVIAHEYFHNWTGNRITCRDWFQLCLKEGLTVFRDQEFSADMRSRPVKRIADVKLLKMHQFPEDAGPLAHPVRPRSYQEINNFYTATIYEKGAEVVRMLQTLLGEDGFRSGLDLYFDRHDGEATTIEAFLKCFEDATGSDLDQFALWYEQAGTPLVSVNTAHNPKDNSFKLTLSQEIPPLPGQQSAKAAVIPLRFGLLGPDGQDLEITTGDSTKVTGDVILLKRPAQTITFQNVPDAPKVSLLRGFSAPVRLTQDQSADDLAFLAKHDSDPYNRWQAVQTLATQTLLARTEAVRRKVAFASAADLVAVLQTVLEDDRLDPALKAQALTLPSETDTAQDIGNNVDPDAIHTARTRLIAEIADELQPLLLPLARDYAKDSAFSPDAASAGKRALSNRALHYHAHSSNPGAVALVNDRFENANNMTDRIMALTLLVHHGFEGAMDALQAFRSRHATSALAMDKWFAARATAPRDETLQVVQDLIADPLYEPSNPNRVRAVLHSFATGNPTQFSRADGKGFNLIAESVLQIDKRNPQVASRLLTSFRSWRALEGRRSSLAESALLRVSSSEELSRDCRDIVDRTLQ